MSWSGMLRIFQAEALDKADGTDWADLMIYSVHTEGFLLLRVCDGRNDGRSADQSNRAGEPCVQDSSVHQHVVLSAPARSHRELPRHQLQREDEERLPLQEEGHAETHPHRPQVSLFSHWCKIFIEWRISKIPWCPKMYHGILKAPWSIWISALCWIFQGTAELSVHFLRLLTVTYHGMWLWWSDSTMVDLYQDLYLV